MTEQQNGARTPPVYAGIFLTCAASVLFEIALTKIFSVTLWYHFAYLAVSLALFGLGAGGLGAFFGRERFDRVFPKVLSQLAALQALVMILALVLVLNTRIENALSLNGFLRFTALFVACAAPFYLVGLTLSLVMSHYSDRVSRIYFADLLGSAGACLLFYIAISLVSGPAVILVAAVLTLAASFFFVESSNSRGRQQSLALLAVGAATLTALNTGTNFFSVTFTKTYEERHDVLVEKWNPLARITVYPKIFWMEDPESPFGWGMSWNYKPERKIEQMWIEQDANAGTPIMKFNGSVDELDYLKHDITAFAYHLRPHAEDAFIIGSGGGRDVLSALAFGVAHVKACDINSVIVDLVKNRFRAFAGNVYGLANVDVEVAEGRSYLRRQTDRFDVIQISLIDSWAATLAGAFSLAENNLYTVEAFDGFFERLKDDGLLTVTRFLFWPRSQSLRLAILGRQALEAFGLEHPEQAIAVIGTSRLQGIATILMARRPFTAEEIADIQAKAGTIGFEVLYVPGGANNDPDFNEAMTATSLDDYLNDAYYDLSPPTDNRPFFFQMLRFTRATDLITQPAAITGQTMNYYAPLVLLILLIISTVLVSLFYVVPLWFARGVSRLPNQFGAYFLCIGLGFMFVEIFLIQKGSLYLGHPTFSLTAVLSSMLAAAGCGSLWSGRVNDASLPAALRKYGATTVVLIVALGFGMEWLTRATIALPLAAKLPVFIALVAPVAFFMGTLFPSGIRLIGRTHAEAVPWVWAINGGASVTGSILAMLVAMTSGYLQTLMVGCACYLGAVLVIERLNARSPS